MGDVELRRIADQIRRVYDGAAWHGTPLKGLLADVTATVAAARPVPSAHTIWELVLHVAFWNTVVTRRLGGEVVSPTPEDDWPRPPAESHAAWMAALASLDDSVEKLASTVVGLEPAALTRPVAGRTDDAYVTLHGIVQHMLYHAGQIALVAKALRSTNR